MVLCDICDLNRLACVAEGVEYRVTVNMVQSHSGTGGSDKKVGQIMGDEMSVTTIKKRPILG